MQHSFFVTHRRAAWSLPILRVRRLQNKNDLELQSSLVCTKLSSVRHHAQRLPTTTVHMVTPPHTAQKVDRLSRTNVSLTKLRTVRCSVLIEHSY